MLGLRVVALFLLCSTPGSATEEDLSTGLKAKLEQMGVDSMAKRVHTWTTTYSQLLHLPLHLPNCSTCHCRRVWVAWRASSAVISPSRRRPPACTLRMRCTCTHTCTGSPPSARCRYRPPAGCRAQRMPHRRRRCRWLARAPNLSPEPQPKPEPKPVPVAGQEPARVLKRTLTCVEANRGLGL